MPQTAMAGEQELLARALRAYFIAGRGNGSVDSPSLYDSEVTEYGPKSDRKLYAVLRNVKGVLAVYRVRNDGMLKRLKRWPAELEER